MTPEAFRAQQPTTNIKLTKVMTMDTNLAADLEPPRRLNRSALLLAGITRHYPFHQVAEIPDQWQKFAPRISEMEPPTSSTTYGVIYNGGEESFDYLTAVEITNKTVVPADMHTLTIPAQNYLCFFHPGHVSSLRETCDAIWSQWIPAADDVIGPGPWFEQYDERFDPLTGSGGIEIWIPITP